MIKFIQISSLIVGLFILTVPEFLYAQSAIVTENESVSVSFPDSITFEIEASGESIIDKATLIYGTNGRSCQNTGSKQVIEFDPGQSVDLAWEWELKRSGSLPPGAEIWWEWQIEDEAGNVFTTERQTQLVEDERFDWTTLESNGLLVNWVEGDQAFGESILEIADESLSLIASDMGVPRPENINVWVYPSSDDVQEALVYSPEWAGGIAFPNYGITILGIAPDQEEWKSQVVPHELVHLVVGELMFNCYGVWLPTWLNEGLARYGERNIESRDLSQFQSVLEAGELPPLKTLAVSFSAFGADASVSYTQSYIIVKYLIDTYGSDKMAELLNTVKSGNRIDAALEMVYGFDTAELDAEWRGTTGFAATPTLEADAIDETPTAVPTLALVNPLESLPTSTPT
ncbi:MAG: peptidase MA family metallohydrolase, partial [Chloroflexota bacterium]